MCLRLVNFKSLSSSSRIRRSEPGRVRGWVTTAPSLIPVRLAVTCDMTALGTHFFPDADPEDVGYKALAVNLSDLAAAGAVPRAFFLSIGLPRRDDGWLADFSRGLMALAHESGCALLGGDTTRTPEIDGRHAPATISITAMGDLPAGMGLTRSGAQPGDDIWVSGTVGDAYAALMCRWGRWQIEWERIPLSPVLSTLTVARQHEAALAGGDDYELIFTAPPAAAERIFEAGLLSNTPVSRIGRILEREETAVVVRTADGLPVAVPSTGYDHFNAEDPE